MSHDPSPRAAAPRSWPRSLLAMPAALLLTIAAHAQDIPPTCDDLVWSAQVLAANPDIRDACRGVYMRDSTLYAKIQIELTRVQGNRLTFRTIRLDDTAGSPRNIVVDNNWRANIEGKEYRASQLQPGQKLSVYIPEDRFALGIPGPDSSAKDDTPSAEDRAGQR